LFIEKYVRVMGKTAQAAQDLALEMMRQWLTLAKPSDFANETDFADAFFEIARGAYQEAFESEAAAAAIKKATGETYKFYRLKDESIFGAEGSPVSLAFGAPDTRSLKFFEKLDSFYFSKFLRNDDAAKPLRKFLADEYISKGAALFGRETPESLDDFRKAAGGALDKLNDKAVYRIAFNSVARIRNWAHVGSLAQAGFELAEYVAVIDKRTTEICREIDGKRLRVAPAQARIEQLNKLTPGEFALEVYESNAMREYRKDPVAWIQQRLTNGILDDDALAQNIGLPPLHILCRTWLEGVFDDAELATPAPAPASEPKPVATLTAAEARAQLRKIDDGYAIKLEDAQRRIDRANLRAAAATELRRELLLSEITAENQALIDLQQKRLTEMRALLEVSDPVNISFKFAKRVGPKVKALAKEGVDLFRRFVSADFLEGKTVTINQTAKRAFQDGEGIWISPNDHVAVVVHELGHWLEQHAPEILQGVVDFHARRTAGESAQRLRDLFPRHGYRRDEWTKKDNYLRAYMGKTYSRGGKVWATEFVSMGLEQFARDPQALAAHDPELFDLIYDLARLKKKQ
jgi:hypothetical protein